MRSEFSLKTHPGLDAMVKGINEIIPLAQGTMTGLAIKYVMNSAFIDEEGDRPKVRRAARFTFPPSGPETLDFNGERVSTKWTLH